MHSHSRSLASKLLRRTQLQPHSARNGTKSVLKLPLFENRRHYQNVPPSPISSNIMDDYNIDGRIPNLSQFRARLPSLNISSKTNSFESISVKGQEYESRPLYLDVQATSPIDPRVIDIMNHYHVQSYGNPHSRTHFFGFESEKAVEHAREQVATLINASEKEIIFTSGATESNNLAIKGIAYFPRRKNRKHIITVETEHKCVLDSCRQLEMDGFKVTYLPVKKDGIIDLDLLKSSITDDTLLVSVMFVNNEIGVIQPIKQIGEICKERGVYFHTDAAQAFGKIPIDVDEMNIDLMSISGHKIYGPKGIGALYVRRRPRVQLRPIISGGGQERGLRSGTLPAPLVVGLGAAAEISQETMESDLIHVKKLYDLLYNGLTNNLEEIILNGSGNEDERYYGNLNVSVAFVEGESLLMGLKNVCVSSGSACTSASLEPSYVLRSIGVTEDLAHTSIRIGIGRFTTEEEIEYTVEEMTKHVSRLREMSPLYDMWKDGSLNQIEWTQH